MFGLKKMKNKEYIEKEKELESHDVKKELTSGHFYNTKTLVQVLENFCKSPEGANARTMLVLPSGRNPMQKEFNIKEVRLIENKLIGTKEKYRCVILVD
mgnify:FL=1